MWFGKMIRGIFKMVLKVLALPVLLLAFILKLIVKLLSGIGSFAIGLVMIVFIICLGMTIYQHLWSQLFLVGLGVIVFLLMTFTGTAVFFILQEAASALRTFVFG